MTKQIFIGGTGRSGTTILGRVLSYHKDIFVYPFETRFIVDPHGVIDVCDNLSDKWEFHRGDKAIKEFLKFMDLLYPSIPKHVIKVGVLYLIQKLNINISPFKHTGVMAKQWKNERFFTYFKHPFSVFIDRDKYYEIIDKFIKKITIKDFSGYWAGTDSLTISPKITLTKKFDKGEICKITGKFVNDLLSTPLPTYHKKMWAEHSPPNLLFASYLVDMFPDGKIIHIYRDFRDVVCSYKTKKWGARTTEDAVYSIKYMLEKWEEERKKIPKDKYIEISLEDLVSNTEESLKKICEFLNVEFDKNMLKVDLSKSHSGRWKKELSKEDLAMVEKHLGKYLEEYGYE